MAVIQASIAIDGSKKRVYVVPPASSFITDMNGYRVYTPDNIPSAPPILFLNVQRDIWSRMVDWWGASNDWMDFPIERSGGAFRGFDELSNPVYATNDYNLDAESGWRIVLPNYEHVTQFRGNFLSNNPDGIMFDNTRLTTIAISRLIGFDSLQTYQVGSVSAITGQDITDIGIEVWANTQGSTLINDVNFIKGIEGGRWEITANQMVFYAEDNTTEVARFDLNDAAGNPTTTEPYERVRV